MVTSSPMPTALRTYNIFFWNSTLKEKPGGTKLMWPHWLRGRPKPLMLKATGRNNFFQRIKFKTMQLQKMSLANIKGKLSRAEMKNIMAGSATCTYFCNHVGGVMCGSTSCDAVANCLHCTGRTYCC